MLLLRTVFLYLFIAVHTLTIGVVGVLICLILPKRWHMKILVSIWTKAIIFYMKWIGGITYRVDGLENIEKGPAGVVLSQHQSAFEPIIYQDLFFPAMHVAKNSLRHIPVFGWGLTMIGTVYINRADKRGARNAILSEGRKKVEGGGWLIIYPEGTRVADGETLAYKLGGAHAAIDYGCDVYPVAHNTGKFWNKKGIVQTGCAHFIVGKGISSEGREARELTQEVQTWIESQEL